MLQRWVSADPLTIHAPGEADPNVYAYVSGRALIAIDPLGLTDPPSTALFRRLGLSRATAERATILLHVASMGSTAIADNVGQGTAEVGTAAKRGNAGEVAVAVSSAVRNVTGTGTATLEGVARDAIAPGEAAGALTQYALGKDREKQVTTLVRVGAGQAQKGIGLAIAGVAAARGAPRATSAPPSQLRNAMAKAVEGGPAAWLDGYMAELEIGCFVAGTPVWTAQGLRPIESIVVGDWVLSRNDRGEGPLTWRQVLQILPKPASKVLSLELEDANGRKERLGVTPNHPFWLERRGWSAAGWLQPGDRVWSLGRGWLKVISVQLQPKLQRVYNFEVDEDHTYAVGGLAVWVHNQCPGGGKVGTLPKPPRGKGSVPPAQRDPKRVWTPNERAAKRDAQGGQCATGCGTEIDESNSRGHHVKRHADGGRTDNKNHAEVCVDCHAELHAK